MKKFLFVLLAAAALAYFYLPYQTTEVLEEALRTSNKPELERMIDFPAVRASAKEQMRTLMRSRMEASLGAAKPSGAGSGVSSAAQEQAMAAMGAMADQMVDAMLTPEGLVQAAKLDPKVDEKARHELREKTWVSPTEFTARAHDRTILRFRFAAFAGWRVTAMELSEELMKSGPR